MALRPPQQFLFKATWSGTIGTEEIFAYSRWITHESDVETSVRDALADEIDVMLAFPVTLGPIPTLESAFPDYVTWTQLKVSPWNPVTNKLKVGREPAYLILDANGNGSAGGGLPYQNALAVTTRSHEVGRRRYNRFYLPTMEQLITDGHGNLQSMVATSFAQWAEVGIENRADADGVVYVNYNPGQDNGNPSEAAGCFPIVDVYLGHRLDTIRRRRNQAPEGRTIQPIS